VTRSAGWISELRSAKALADAAAVVSRRIPAPRGLPFFGLDHPPGILDRVLAELANLGIFRHYSHVIDVSGGLAGPARWLARREGCRVSTVEGDRAVAAAASLLTATAHLEDRVATIVASAERLPFGSGVFTHAWRIEPPDARADRKVIFGETWRVLRAGGWLAAVGATDAELRDVGFREIESIELDSLAEDDSTAAHLVAERVAETLGTESVTAERASARAPLAGWRARKPA
jgi:ubiquinone/menaquinone biosynthesis C-methylase UbiE